MDNLTDIYIDSIALIEKREYNWKALQHGNIRSELHKKKIRGEEFHHISVSIIIIHTLCCSCCFIYMIWDLKIKTIDEEMRDKNIQF